MISSFIRNFIGVAFWLVLTAVCLYASLQVVLANYLGCKAALELQGYEQQPLSTDPLVGHLFGTFFAGATLAQFFALGVAIIVSLALFGLCHIGSEVYELNEARIDTIKPEEKGRAKRRIYLWLLFAAVLMVALIWAISWDLALFRYRTIAGAMTGGEPDITPLAYPGMSEFLAANDHLFISALVQIGPWGYLAITILSCVLLEVAFRQLSDRWSRLMDPIDNLFEPEEFYGYDELGQPVYDRNAAVTYDTNGDAIAIADDDSVLDETVLVPTRQAVQTVDADVSSNGGAPAGMRSFIAHADDGQLFYAPAPPMNPDTPWPDEVEETTGSASTDLREVIGAPGTRVTLEEALGDSRRYRVDHATGRVWDRSIWEALHGAPTDSEIQGGVSETNE